MKKFYVVIAAAAVALIVGLASCSMPVLDVDLDAVAGAKAASLGSWPVLKTGSSGVEVYTLQYLLNAHGISCGVDGQFGSGTAAAVKTFQSRKGLTADGVVGQLTWQKLFITVQYGSSGNAVKALQYELRYCRGYTLTVDGQFGSGTKNAVLDYQRKCGIAQDGVAGPTTWAYVICGSNVSFTYDNIKRIIQSKGYSFFTGQYNVNLVGVRSANRTAGSWDDWFFILYQENGVNKIRAFDEFTTDPGSYYLQYPINSAGCAITVPGQHRGVWQIGIHNGKYEALVQTGGTIRVYRDNDRDATLDMLSSTIQTGMFGINLHHGYDSATIGQYSAGCQVFRHPADLTTVLGLCKKSRDLYGNSFTYTLLNIGDF